MSTPITTGMALAAGRGTRMKPLTDTRPKALVEVGGKALLDWALDRFADAGVENAIVNIHHFADQMEDHLARRDGAPAVTISDERDSLLETGGGLVKALPLLGDDPVFVTNIDAVWIDEWGNELKRLAGHWDPNEMDALLLLAPLERTLGFDGPGDFFVDPAGGLEWRGDRDKAPFAYAGAHIVNPAIFKGEAVRPFSLVETWKKLSAEGRLHGLPMDSFWMHVGDPQAREDAEAHLKVLRA